MSETARLAPHPWDQAANEIFAGAQTVGEAVRLRDEARVAFLRRQIDDCDSRWLRLQEQADELNERSAAYRAELVSMGVDPDAIR